jgi:predicted O-methyltransferase YrrM
LLRADSYDTKTLSQVQTLLRDQPVDFLFLDGDHSYQGIKTDFEMYAPLVKKGGLVAFHGIEPSTIDNWIQVGRFWNEIKTHYAYQEFLDPEISWGGIGVLTQR